MSRQGFSLNRSTAKRVATLQELQEGRSGQPNAPRLLIAAPAKDATPLGAAA